MPFLVVEQSSMQPKLASLFHATSIYITPKDSKGDQLQYHQHHRAQDDCYLYRIHYELCKFTQAGSLSTYAPIPGPIHNNSLAKAANPVLKPACQRSSISRLA
jgi:hypothetical protein